MKQTLAILAGIFFLAVFTVFSVAVKKHALDQMDFDMAVKIQDHIPRKFDSLFSLVTILGDTMYISVPLLIFFVLHRRWRNVLTAVFYIAGLSAEVLGKTFFRHPSPPFLFFRYNPGFHFTSTFVFSNFSYPSGHTFRTLFIVIVLSGAIWKLEKVPESVRFAIILACFAFAGLMMSSLVILGEHWLSDVIGGVFLAIALGVWAIEL